MPEWQKTAEWPLASFSTMVALMGGYVVVIKGLQAFMKNREALRCTMAGHVHNVIMTALSAYVFFGMGYDVIQNWKENNFDPSLAVCDPELKLSKNADYWFWIFYVSKFYEYIDTILLVLRKKPVIFLHAYHHFITASIVWAAWIFPGASNWVGPITNAFVHIWMYAYYMAADFGLSRKWGAYITKIQLTQFMGCIALWACVGLAMIPDNSCKTPAESFSWLCLQYVIFLYLFRRFDSKRNGKKPAAATATKSVAASAAGNEVEDKKRE
ncbi:hypothetical protein CAOG_05364 [Capsaspora owczarzaki ATCC 30864]|uniref:Elongation of fatty acids protein n=1 Tax=Capsaspora owczarzaki (strain ATCC 30864) TaxID=595528 RepID=A0A0D2VTX4_CAPO3|nr:hypothetical protein CAOG_05364 [Capsaspora owczarzaki ATCC 30864]KJE94782.1 hypothetical protein CAOG_005364 [Capsaspora owczarzaki ATCC 30864]|eukprot:XP_004347049.1 hypothetical protein CAOG_05364 [Capsaspora owczarzaki ATCC 30864]